MATPAPKAPVKASAPVSAPAKSPVKMEKVGTTATTTNEADAKAARRAQRKAEKASRPAFNFEKALGKDGKPTPVVNIAGENEPANMRLNGPVVNWTPDYKPLKRTAFASRSVYIEHKATLCEVQANALMARAAELRADAEGTSSTADPLKRKERRLAKMLKAAQALKAELAGQGIDVEALLAGLTGADAADAE